VIPLSKAKDAGISQHILRATAQFARSSSELLGNSFSSQSRDSVQHDRFQYFTVKLELHFSTGIQEGHEVDKLSFIETKSC
jgi:hypothetical protein